MIMNNGYLNYSSLVLDVPVCLFFRFPHHNLYVSCIPPTGVTCTTHIIFLDFNSFIIFGAGYTEGAMPFLLIKKKSLFSTNFNDLGLDTHAYRV